MSARTTLVQSVLGPAQDHETHIVELLWHVIGHFRHVVGHAKPACFTAALLLTLHVGPLLTFLPGPLQAVADWRERVFILREGILCFASV